MTATMPLGGLRVAAFEGRMAGPLAELIRKHGGEPVEAPALREIPLDQNPDAVAFGRDLIAGRFDVVIFLTGVGARYLSEVVESRQAFLDALRTVTVVARGPKPRAVLREWGVPVAVAVPEPNTWHEVLAALDAHRPVAGLRVAVQEYGQPSPELVEGLESRGAVVTPVPVYRWALPEDLGPLREATGAILEGTIDAVLFTTGQQVVHLFQVAEQDGRATELRDALLHRVVIGSIGPTTSEALRQHGLSADIEPEHSKMGHLVSELAARWREVAMTKGRLA